MARGYHFTIDESVDFDEDQDSGSPTWTWDTANSRLELTNATAAHSRQVLKTITSDDQDVQGRYRTTNTNSFFGSMANWQSGTQFYMTFFGGGNWTLFKRDGGFTQIGSASGGPTANTYFVVRLTTATNGSNKDLNMYVDGVLKIGPVSTSTLFTNGRAGFNFLAATSQTVTAEWWAFDLSLGVTSLDPNSGTEAGGTNVAITGSDIGDGSLAEFDGIGATGIVVMSATQLNCVTPAHVPAAVDVKIKFGTLGSEEFIGTLINGYTYTVEENPTIKLGRVNQAFIDAQKAPASEMKKELKAWLRNQAASAEGSVATGDDIDTDHPADGAIDGDATHLNLGPGSGAENGIGKGGWKSSDASLSNTETSAADWNGGTQTSTKTINDAVETAFDTSRYEQDFDGLTSGSALATQDSWAVLDAPESGNSINVETSAAFGGAGKGVRVLHINTGITRTARSFTPGTLLTCSFRFKEITNQHTTGNKGSGLVFLTSADADLFNLGFHENQEVQRFTPAAGAWQRVTTGRKVTASTWHRVVIHMDRTTVASTIIRVFIDGEQIHEETVDTTDLAKVVIQGNTVSNLDIDGHFDDLRIGDSLQDQGRQENVFDLGATAVVSGRAELDFNGEAHRVETLVPGAFYGKKNEDSGVSMRTATTQKELAQTFEVDSDSPINAVWLALDKNGTPAPDAQTVVFVEIRDTTGGTPEPGTTVYARSTEIETTNIAGTTTMIKFDFPAPFYAKAGVRYALVYDGKYDINASNNTSWRDDNSSPGYSNGQAFLFNGDTASWTAQTRDKIFSFVRWTEPKAAYADTNQDAKLDLRLDTATTAQGQGFKVADDIKVQYAQIQVEVVGTLPANSTVWWEIWDDDGAGKPNAKLIEGVHHDANVITWTALQHFILSLPREFQLTGGTQYHMVIQGNYSVASNRLRLGVDNSAASYADGVRNTGALFAGALVWTSTTTSDMIFQILGVHKPFIRFDVASSTDDISYGSFAQITDNPTQAASLSDVAFTGDKNRYWKTRAEFQRKITGGNDEPWTPILSDYTTKVIFRTRKHIKIDMGQNRTIRGMELYAHPTEHGFRQILIEHSTDDIGYTTITAFDELAARKKGGGAADPANASGTITTDGDYLRLIFDADITMRYFKVWVEDNTDEWARIMEARAFRVVDWTDRWTAHSENQSGDPLFRRVGGRNTNLTLENVDFFLSAKRTEGGYNDEVGAGTKLFPKIGYEGGATLVPRGVFHVEKWPERIMDPRIRAKMRDGTKLMNTQVRAKYTVRRRVHELIEYLGNLAGIPSTDMDLAQTANSVDFYLGKEVNAYQECQKLAESVAFSRLFFNELGYLVFQVVGNSLRDTQIQSHAALDDPQRTLGPPVFLDDKMYITITNTDGGNEEILLFQWDITTSVWTNKGQVATGLARSNATLVAFDSKIWIASWIATGSSTLGKLQAFDPTDDSFTTKMSLLPEFNIATYDPPGQFDGAGGDDGIVRNMVSQIIQGHKWIISCESSRGKYHKKPYEIDLFALRDKALSDITGWSAPEAIMHTVRTESNKIVVGMQREDSGNVFRFDEWDYDKKTVTNKLLPPGGTTSGHFVGMDNVGDGTLWVVFSSQTNQHDKGARISKLDVSSGTWVLTEGDAVADFADLADFAEGDAVAYADGLVMSYWGQLIGSDNRYNFMMRDNKASNVINTDMGPIGSSGTARVGQFRSYQDTNGVWWIYGIMDDFRIFEFRVRASLPTQETSVKTISESSEGLVRDAVADRTDEAGGEATIINVAYIKSQPKIAEPALEQVWEGDNFPWGINNDTLIEFDVELEEECDPSTIAFKSGTPTYADSGAGTASLKDVVDGGSTIRSTNRVRISIDVTGTGRITALALEGKPLRRQGTLIGVALGSKQSKNRYGIRQFSKQNDYIYNPMNLIGIAKSLVDRFDTPKQRLTGLRCLVLWDIQMFDRVTIVIPTMGINGDYYVTGISGSFESPDMTLDAIEV